jgi:hypothetical protein
VLWYRYCVFTLFPRLPQELQLYILVMTADCNTGLALACTCRHFDAVLNSADSFWTQLARAFDLDGSLTELMRLAKGRFEMVQKAEENLRFVLEANDREKRAKLKAKTENREYEPIPMSDEDRRRAILLRVSVDEMERDPLGYQLDGTLSFISNFYYLVK